MSLWLCITKAATVNGMVLLQMSTNCAWLYFPAELITHYKYLHFLHSLFFWLSFSFSFFFAINLKGSCNAMAGFNMDDLKLLLQGLFSSLLYKTQKSDFLEKRQKRCTRMLLDRPATLCPVLARDDFICTYFKMLMNKICIRKAYIMAILRTFQISQNNHWPVT